MSRPGERVEAITVPRGDPEALEGSATQLRAVGGQLTESAARLAAMPSLLSSWAGPGSSSFALLSGNQADTVRAQGAQVSMAALSVQTCADVLADSQRDARRAIEHAEQARREIDRAKAEIADAKGDQDAAGRRMDAAMAARSVAERVPLLGGTGLEAAAVAIAEDDYRAAERDLHVAQGRERRARGRLGEAEDEMRRARKDGQIAAETAESSGTFLEMALGRLPAGALAMGGAPAAGQIAAQGGIERPQVRDVPISEREPPKDWPGWRKTWFKLGRGEATAISGMFNLGRSAVEHPTQVPGALRGFGAHAVDDPLGTGKQLIGYDELARGRYEDWLGQMGIGLLTAKTGSLAGRGARLTRVRGEPRIEPVRGAATPINSGRFAGSRLDFGRDDLGRHPGTKAPVLATEARREMREKLALEFPKGVRFTRAGYPVLTPYAKETVHLEGLKGIYELDAERANAEFGRTHTPEGFTWHHVEDGKTLELVPTPLHKEVRHTGSAGALRAGDLNPVPAGGAFTGHERAIGHAGAGAGFLGGPAAAPDAGSGP